MRLGTCTECGCVFDKNYTTRAQEWNVELEEYIDKTEYNGHKYIDLFVCPACESEQTGDGY